MSCGCGCGKKVKDNSKPEVKPTAPAAKAVETPKKPAK